MFTWIAIGSSVCFLAIVIFILLGHRSHHGDAVSKESFIHYKSKEMQKRGHYHDIVR